ncbi:two-component system response regulator YesN [Paenibacillus rhizosphaerae]|uniref:Two-component system response regulator YesN n=1 Tax=Paenibacillus rhizosphaerae TaxID=297318 RepID=A0A839TIP4_9BACL|nr:helix-turn-helix domain-containing protein [Paenibacillus rhizosphaerae]MBB3126675.1 two-component system response regulator YesN [Paenibacillus rhizosphaerae]
MYRLLIVDDEPEIRQGLRLKMDMDGLGIALAGEASNGMEALSLLENGDIEIVLTDMNMPLMGGVRFMEVCRERYPNVRVIVITGYEDFQYARAALRFQASEYLLKPVARDELNSVLKNVTAELNREREKAELEAKTQWELSQYYREMKEQFILRLVRWESGPESVVTDRARKFGLGGWEERRVRFMTLGLKVRDILHGTDRAPDQFLLPLEMISREKADNAAGTCECFRDGHYPGLIHVVTTESVEWLFSFGDHLRSEVKRMLDFELDFGIGQPVTGFKAWKDGYLSSLVAWNYTDSRLPAESLPQSTDKTAISADEIKVIERYLAKGEYAAFEQAVRPILQQAFTGPVASRVKIIFQLYLALESAASDLLVTIESAEQLWIRPELAYSLDSVDKAYSFLAGIARNIVRQREEGAEAADVNLIESVRRYIDDHYATDLNLSDMAARFNYHPSYFSELFKKRVGRTFIQYLTDVRMTQAIRLLEETQLSLWDIAELTGFSNASYFSSKFKKVYGVSPSDYRERLPEKIDSEEPKK